MSTPDSKAELDDFAANYDAALDQGIGISGENKEFFARNRVAWLGGWLQQTGFQPREVIDFGCGTGAAMPHLLRLPGVNRVLRLDVSTELLEIARHQHAAEQYRFLPLAEHVARGDTDLVFCNGVFHHIPPPKRMEALHHIRDSLRPSGWFVLWENNPWNPGTRYVMSRIPFDRGALMLTAHRARRQLVSAGFEVLSTNYLFIFPRMLRWLRWIEPLVCRLPLGAQYQILARKPS